ncbi:MAG: radical SAM protein [archaeon]
MPDAVDPKERLGELLLELRERALCWCEGGPFEPFCGTLKIGEADLPLITRIKKSRIRIIEVADLDESANGRFEFLKELKKGDRIYGVGYLSGRTLGQDTIRNLVRIEWDRLIFRDGPEAEIVIGQIERWKSEFGVKRPWVETERPVARPDIKGERGFDQLSGKQKKMLTANLDQYHADFSNAGNAEHRAGYDNYIRSALLEYFLKEQKLMIGFRKEDIIARLRAMRFMSWENGIEAPPLKIDAELHTRCNLKCRACTRQGAGPDLNMRSMKREMPLGKWLDIVEESYRAGVLIWNIEGACEPMMVPELCMPVMKSVKENDRMYGVMTTNGTLWTERLIKDTISIGWDRLHFSIDGAKAETHDMLRGVKGAFDKTLDTIQQFNRLRKGGRPEIYINFVTNRLNYRELPEMIELAHGLNVKYVFTEPLIEYHSGGSGLKLTGPERGELPGYVEKARVLADRYGIETNFTHKDQTLQDRLVKSAGELGKAILEDANET